MKFASKIFGKWFLVFNSIITFEGNYCLIITTPLNESKVFFLIHKEGNPFIFGVDIVK